MAALVLSACASHSAGLSGPGYHGPEMVEVVRLTGVNLKRRGEIERLLRTEQIEFAVFGTFAHAMFVRPEDLTKAIRTLERAGFTVARDP